MKKSAQIAVVLLLLLEFPMEAREWIIITGHMEHVDKECIILSRVSGLRGNLNYDRFSFYHVSANDAGRDDVMPKQILASTTLDSIPLCIINGEKWFYTNVTARKILSTDYKPREKFVLNFKNENSAAQENISLMYNANTKQLEYVDIALQDPNEEEGRRVFVGISGFTEEEIGQIKDIGALSHVERLVSGTANFLIPRNSRGVFKNELDVDIVVSKLQFDGIQFEDDSN